MINKLLTKAALLTALVLVAGLLLISGVADAGSIQEDIQGGVDSAAGASGASDPNTSLQNTITGIVNILSILVGVVAVIMLVYAGYLYITSAGDASKVTAAKRAILYAVIGIAIAAAAQVIVKFVLNEATNPSAGSSQLAGAVGTQAVVDATNPG